nr:FAD synthase-like [Leptinotarsa decemlineata]
MVKSVVLVFFKKETISSFFVYELTNLGYEVDKVFIQEESEKVVTDQFTSLSRHYDIVIAVFDVNNRILTKALANICGEDSKSLDGLPSASKKLINGIVHPVIYLHRIFILRKDVAEKQFTELLKPHLETYAARAKFSKVVHLQKNGNTSSILKKLNELVSVQLEDLQELSRITITHENFENVVEGEQLLKKELHDKFVESYEENDVLECIYRSKEAYIRRALEVIEECFESYGAENIFLSFNGGKDCTVLLHLVYTVLRMKYPNYKKPILCHYVKSEDTFSEQDRFISQCQTYYNLDIISVTLEMKEALGQLLKCRPNLKACLMGTRKTDPYSGELSVFQMTDPDWPQVMRVNPILHWHYSDIWDYLLYYKIPYCKLYDMGYTSLGNASNTIKNPSLAYFDEKLGAESYLPAYKMMNESEERSGRNARL